MTDVTRETFSVSVIPHTAACTNLAQRRIGDTVNLENDCIGKYVERLLSTPNQQSNITLDFLAKHGF